MCKVLLKVFYIVFIGMLLFKKEKIVNKFGFIVYVYLMQCVVEDEIVVLLLYEECVFELDINEEVVNCWFDKIIVGLLFVQSLDFKKKFVSKCVVYGVVNCIELIVWDIVIYFNENIKQLDLGLKGQVVIDSKCDVICYKWVLDDIGLVISVVVIFLLDMCEGNSEVDEDVMLEVQKWWKQNIVDLYFDFGDYEKQVLYDFGSDGVLDLLIVVDKLFIGFDELCNIVFYIDKFLKDYNLIQVVVCVNCLYDVKCYGVLVDYCGIFKELDIVVCVYQELEECI